MREKRPARREFLRNGAALAGGFTLSAAAPALGQHAPAQPPMIKGEREGEIAYGARSKYVTSARIPHGGRPSPDNFGLTFHVATPLAGSGRGHHAVLAPLLRDDAWRVPAGYRSCAAHADDPRPGGSSADLHRGRPEAPPVGDAPALHRVRRQQSVATCQDRAGNARHDEQCGMDRRAAVHAAQGVRRERQRQVVRRRGRGRSEGRVEHAGRQGNGRLHRSPTA